MNISNLSNTQTALLGLLSESAMHPYEIEQEVKHRDMRSWTELSMSSIYKLLRKLENEGMVYKKEEKSQENRLRKLYSISPEGERALKSRIRQLLSEPEHIRWQLDIGTYNSNLLPEPELREALLEYRQALRAKISGYRDLRKSLEKSGYPHYRQALAIRPVYLLEAEISWVNSFLNR